MYNTNVNFKCEGRDLNMYKTARQLGISVGASFQMAPLIDTGQPRLIYLPPFLTMNCTDLIFLCREEVTSVNPKCSHVRLTAKYHNPSMIFRPPFPPSLSDSNCSVYLYKDAHWQIYFHAVRTIGYHLQYKKVYATQRGYSSRPAETRIFTPRAARRCVYIVW